MTSQELRPYQEDAIDAAYAELNCLNPILVSIATGGGKTLVANHVAQRMQLTNGRKTLYVSKSWELLKQAATSLRRNFPHAEKLMGRIGGDGSCLSFLPRATTKHSALYTTLHSFKRQHHQVDQPLGLIVYDESHFAEKRLLGQVLFTYARDHRIPVLGVTATPNADGSNFRNVYSRSFNELVDDGYLARPIFITHKTQTDFHPELSTAGDFSPRSLNLLARNRSRNEGIVDHYFDNMRNYGKTIVFACNAAHANRLTHIFQMRGVPAAVLHSHRSQSENRDALESFRAGSVTVLVNVNKATEGIDVPDVKTLFMCRPTTSSIRYAQMIGRGSRLCPAIGKKSFYVVECTDNTKQYGHLIVTKQTVFATAFSRPLHWRPPVGKRARKHTFNPESEPVLIPPTDQSPESSHDLWYLKDCTFGVEFELTGQDWSTQESWRQIAEPIRLRLQEALGHKLVAPRAVYSHQTFDHSVWNVKYDSSAGWEISSRVLKDHRGLFEIDHVCQALTKAADELGLRVNYQTGTHIHLAWQNTCATSLKRLIRLIRYLQPGLAGLVSPSRVLQFDGRTYLPEPNEYCMPLRPRNRQTNSIGRLLSSLRSHRYRTVNFANLGSTSTIEVRWHNGTLEADKILLWLSLWMQVLHVGLRPYLRVPHVTVPSISVPTANICEQITRLRFPCYALPAFQERLAKRQAEIRNIWLAKPSLMTLAQQITSAPLLPITGSAP